MKRPFIKRVFSIILAAIMAPSLTACTKSGPAASIGSQPSAVSSAEVAPVAADNATFRDESGKVILNSTHIKSVKPTKSDGENYAVLITFTKEGADILANATANMVGQEMSLYIYEEAVFTAQITTSIVDGKMLLGDTYTKEQAYSMAEDIEVGLKGEVVAPATEEPIPEPKALTIPGDFPEGWNDLTGTVTIDDFTAQLAAADPSFSIEENPLNFAGGAVMTASGWSNGAVAIMPYQIDTLDPPLWGVAFGDSGNIVSVSIVLYENAQRGIFWFDQDGGTMSAPLACALWLACEEVASTTTPQERREAWESVRAFVKETSITARQADIGTDEAETQNEQPAEPTRPAPPSDSANNADISALLGKMQNSDFSDLAGTYYSERYGSATIIEDGTIMLDTYYVGGDTTPQSNVIFNSTDRWDETDIRKPEDADYIFWRIQNSNYYHPQLNGEIMLEDWITVFPPGVQTVGNHFWNGFVINCPDMDTSEYRFVLRVDGESVMENEVFVRQSQITGEGAPSTDVLLNGFELFRDIGFSSEQQDIIRSTVREFFLANYPNTKTLTADINTLSYDTGTPDITYIDLTSDADGTFRIKLDRQGSILKLVVSIFDEGGTQLN